MFDLDIFPFYNINNCDLTCLFNEDTLINIPNLESSYFDPLCMSDSYNSNVDPDVGNFSSINNRSFSFSKYYEYTDLHGVLNSGSSIPKLKIISQNIRSLNKNLDEFFHDIDDFDFDVVAVNETWLSNNVEQLYASFQNYNGVFKSRNTLGGGVGIFVSKALSFSLIDELSFIEPDVESVFIKISFPNHELLLGNIYRPPRGNINAFISRLEFMLNLYQSNFAQFPLHLVGDYNIDILKHLECASVQNFTNLMFSFNLNPIIRRPTRISNFSATLLDHMWTNDVHVKNSGIIRSLVTDHYSVFSIIEVETESTSFNSDMITYRNMSTSNKLLFRNKLSLISPKFPPKFSSYHIHFLGKTQIF